MNENYWKIPFGKPVIPTALLAAGYSPLLAEALALLGISSPEDAERFVHCDISCLNEPFEMAGMDKAVSRIKRAIEDKEAVAVFGDYDVDGITSTCLLTDYLRSKGLECMPYIPRRSDEGYGLNTGALDVFYEKGIRLVITVDCGITAFAEAEYASGLGMDMIITDHHECKGSEVPNAASVIDCKQECDSYPNKYLAGVGVAFKLICACEGNPAEILDRYSDLVAVGTVADVMPLLGENRYFVKCGLEKLRLNPRPGFSALLRESHIDPSKISASTIGFSIAPRVNAAGRVGDAKTAQALLMEESPLHAEALAKELCALNTQRQAEETDIWSQALRIMDSYEPGIPIVLYNQSWHQGVIGIVASRIADRFSLPTVMICQNGVYAKGSCRSFGNFNLYQALSECAAELVDFGGHALAAGLTIEADRIDSFRMRLGAYYSMHKPQPPPKADCSILISDSAMLSPENVASLDMLEPYGNSNPKPVMCLFGARVESFTYIKEGKHLKLKLSYLGEFYDAIFFSHNIEPDDIVSGNMVDIAFSPQINEYRGRRSVQLVVSALRRHSNYELCEAVLSGELEEFDYTAAAYCPCRNDFKIVWRYLVSSYSPLPSDTYSLIQTCPSGVNEVTYAICLRVFLTEGFLSSKDSVLGAMAVKPDRKADLNNNEIIKRLSQLRLNM